MPIASTDLIAYAAASMPDTDAGTNGGAIDALRRIAFTQIAANDTIQAVSSAAGDTTQTVTIEGRNAAGSVVTETKTLTGTTAITLSTMGTVERVLKAELSATCVGTITIRRTTGPVTLATIPIGERGFMALFRKAASDPSVQKDYYTKIFLKNAHATLSLLAATVKQSADPDARIMHLLATAVGDSATAADRLTVPATSATQDPDTFDDTDKAVPGTDLAAGAAIGVWLRLRLPAADAPHRSTYDISLSGQSV
jgi:hypothetical protein